MIKMLTSTERRQLSIIEYLVKADGWVDLETVSIACNCSIKTLNSDLLVFDSEWKKYFMVEFSKKKGVILRQSNDYKMDDIYSRMLRSSQAFQLTERIFFEPNHDPAYWSNQLFISESSLYRMISRINKLMTVVHVQVSSNPLVMIGEHERYLRHAYSNYFEEAYGEAEWPFKEIDQKKILFLAREFEDVIGFELSDLLLKRQAYVIAVCFVRMRQGFYLETLANSSTIETQLDRKIAGFQEKFEEAVNFPLPENWHIDLAHTLFSLVYGWDNKEEQLRILNQVRDFLDQLISVSELPIKEDDYRRIIRQIIFIYTQYKFYPYARYSLFNNLEFQASRTYEDYPIFSKQLRDNLMLLEKKTHFPWYTDFFYHITHIIYAEWTSLTVYLDRRRRKVKILVTSSLGSSHVNLLATKILQHYQENVEVIEYQGSMYAFDLKREEQFDDYNLVISTTHWPNIPSSKLIVVDYLPTSKQMAEIGQGIGRIQLRIHRFEDEIMFNNL